MSNEIAAAPTLSFGAEFQTCWQQLPNKLLFFALLAAWLLLFYFCGNSTLGYSHSPSLLYWLFRAYRGEESAAFQGDDAQGILIPFAVIVLLWVKRKKLLANPLRLWAPGLGIVSVALLMHLFGFLIQQPRISAVALFVGIYGLMGLAWGPAWLRASLFPCILFAFAVPMGSAAIPVSFRLRLLVAKLVALIAQHILGINVICDGATLYKMPNQYAYEVAAACSGIRSLIAILAIAIIYAFTALDKGWKRVVLIASGIPLAVLGNTVRLLAIIVAAEIGGQAQGSEVHESPVWSMLPYIPAMLGLIFLGRWLEGPVRKSAAGTEAGTKADPSK